MYKEFSNLLNNFYEKNYDPIDLSCDSFVEEYVKFDDIVSDMDKQLVNILNRAFENCHNMYLFFKVPIYILKTFEPPC